MSHLTFQIIPALQTLKIIGNTNEFENWIQLKHPDKDINSVFEGYRFSISCCINYFLNDLSSDHELDIKNDFLLDCAISQRQPIHLLPNSCEKTIFLKNIKSIVKEVVRARNYNEISQALHSFNNSIIYKFDTIFNNCITISSEIGIDKQIATDILLIDFAHTFLVQIDNNGPTANAHNPLSVKWTKEESKNIYLEGYKYAIQFLWFKLLGEEKFNQTHLSKLHLADSWRKYKYIEKEKSGNELFDMMNQEFNLEEQTNFDSYFYWIKREITDPLGEQYKTPVYSIDSYFKFSPDNYNKIQLFGDLLDSSGLKNEQALSWNEKIEQCLYWYPFELIDSKKSKMFFGIPSFNTMLAGTITLHKPKNSEFSKIIAVKFIHPHSDDKEKRDYSYGILIDTMSAAGHYSSGWIIYQNACCDYSGFSGSEHKTTEKLLAHYEKKGKIELRQLTIPLKEFQAYTDQHVLDHKQLSILEQNKLIPDIIQKSRAHLFELFTYYLCTKYYENEFKIEFNSDKNSEDGEKDVVLTNSQEVILIECKLNPQSYNMAEIVQKIKKKLQKYKQQRKSCQFWFWYQLSPQNQAILHTTKVEDKPIKIVTVSNPKGEKILKGISLKQLKKIMQDYSQL